MPFTPRAKKALELALREALSLGHNHIGTEHLLLGIVREDECVGAKVLLEFGADAESVRSEVLRALGPAVPRPFRSVPTSPRSRLDAIEERLAKIEKRLEAIERRLPPEPH
jgi:ATP-dependent Clp protease ATP-binding subunit ClpC